MEALARRPDIFRLTVFKDAWLDRPYSRQGHRRIDPHAYITYYDARLLAWMCPWLREDQLLRTYHSLDPADVPPFRADRPGWAIITGATSPAVYPLRQRIVKAIRTARNKTRLAILTHPGYGAFGVQTATYMAMLSRYRVAVCTSSVFGLPLRKIIEATACGCAVVTDLPRAEKMPGIDQNMTRVRFDATVKEVLAAVDQAATAWDADRQASRARAAVLHYNWRGLYARLATAIEAKRRSHASPTK